MLGHLSFGVHDLARSAAFYDAILAPLDNATMAALNAKVSAEGQEPAAVAKAFLVEQGIIAG